MTEHFNALVLEQAEDGVECTTQSLTEDRLPEGDVLVRVDYSDLNYKDGLVLNGLGKLVRTYPHVPGIDFAGTVEHSDNPDWSPGDQVILTGWHVGERWWGGYSQKARVKGEWLVPLPHGLSPKQAMALGTAGFTAMLAVGALEHQGLTKDHGEVLVTGAGGGVGGVAVSLLSDLGYTVAASTGRESLHDYLKDLGASTIVDRKEIESWSGKPLDSERWAGCVDSVGGETLATVLSQLRNGGGAAACGLAGGADLKTSVIPFLLRGVNLLGINSVTIPNEPRRAAWNRLAQDLDLGKLDRLTEVIPLEHAPVYAERILKGQTRGRVVIDVNHL